MKKLNRKFRSFAKSFFTASITAATISPVAVLSSSCFHSNESKLFAPPFNYFENQQLELNKNPYSYDSSPVPYYPLYMAQDVSVISDGYINLKNHSLHEIFINSNVANYFLDIFKSNNLIGLIYQQEVSIDTPLPLSLFTKLENKVNTDPTFLSELNLSGLYKKGEPNYFENYFVKFDENNLKYKILNPNLTEAKINSISALNNPNLKNIFKNVKKIDLSNNDLIFVPDFNNIFEIGDTLQGKNNLSGIYEINLEHNKLCYIDDNLYKIMYLNEKISSEYGIIKINNNNMPYYLVSWECINDKAAEVKAKKKFIDFYTLENLLIEVIQNFVERDLVETVLQWLIKLIIQKGDIEENLLYIGMLQTCATNINWQDLFLIFEKEFKHLKGEQFEVTEFYPSYFGWDQKTGGESWAAEEGKFGAEAEVIFKLFTYPVESDPWWDGVQRQPLHLISHCELKIDNHGQTRLRSNNYDGMLSIMQLVVSFYIRKQISEEQIIAIAKGLRDGVEQLIDLEIIKYIIEGGDIIDVVDELTDVIQIIKAPLQDVLSFNLMYDVVAHIADFEGFLFDSTIFIVVISTISAFSAIFIGSIVWFNVKKIRDRKQRKEKFGQGEN